MPVGDVIPSIRGNVNVEQATRIPGLPCHCDEGPRGMLIRVALDSASGAVYVRPPTQVCGYARARLPRQRSCRPNVASRYSENGKSRQDALIADLR